MKIEKITNQSPQFGAKVAPKFENMMRELINMGENRKKNQYRLNQKIEDYNSFGYQEYTIDLVEKYKGWGREYSLVAVKDGEEVEDGIFLAKKYSFRQIADKFLKMPRGEFNFRMRAKGRLND